MPSSVSEKISTINEKINSANKKLEQKEYFSTIAKYIIVGSSLYSLPYYYYFFNKYLFT